MRWVGSVRPTGQSGTPCRRPNAGPWIPRAAARATAYSRTVRRRMLLCCVVLSAASTLDCGEPKEAEDPSQILAEDLDSHRGEDEADRSGGGRVGDDTSGAPAPADPGLPCCCEADDMPPGDGGKRANGLDMRHVF